MPVMAAWRPKGVGAVAPPPLQHTDGLISQWLFSEGTGTSVADTQAANNINLSAPTNPNYTWNSRGIALAAGLIQTPSLTGARTVAMLYKTKRASSSGFLISGGPSGSGSGVLQDGGSFTYPLTIAGGWGVHTLAHQSTNNARELNRGGYILIFQEFPSASNTILGFGGRHSTTTSRCDEFEIVAAAVWNDPLTSDERNTAYTYFRYVAKQKSVYLNYQDCPTQRRAVILIGESTADGRAPISSLSAGDQAQVFTKTYILSGNSTTQMVAPDVFDLGVNQQQTAPATDMGPELGLAQRIELGSETVNLLKQVQGSTFTSAVNANGVNQPTSGNTWNGAAEGLIFTAMWSFYSSDQASRAAGVGLNVVGVHMDIGLNDATDVDYAGGSAAAYKAQMHSVRDAIHTYSGLSNLPWHITRCHNHDASSNATALGYVRQGQADFISDLGSLGQIMDTDALGLYDGVHWNAAGNLSVGQAAHAFLLP